MNVLITLSVGQTEFYVCETIRLDRHCSWSVLEYIIVDITYD